MPLFIVLTFHSPTGPQQSLPCGTQSVGWGRRLTEPYDENPNFPREESLLRCCFPNIKLTFEMQWVILQIVNKVCKNMHGLLVMHVAVVSVNGKLVLRNCAS